jgi:hypothetical protein
MDVPFCVDHRYLVHPNFVVGSIQNLKNPTAAMRKNRNKIIFIFFVEIKFNSRTCHPNTKKILICSLQLNIRNLIILIYNGDVMIIVDDAFLHDQLRDYPIIRRRPFFLALGGWVARSSKVTHT